MPRDRFDFYFYLRSGISRHTLFLSAVYVCVWSGAVILGYSVILGRFPTRVLSHNQMGLRTDPCIRTKGLAMSPALYIYISLYQGFVTMVITRIQGYIWNNLTSMYDVYVPFFFIIIHRRIDVHKQKSSRFFQAS